MAIPADHNRNLFTRTLYSIRVYYENLPARTRRLILTGAGIFATLVIILSVALLRSSGKDDYRVLYTGLDTVEAIEVHAAVRELGVEPRVDSKGQISVPSSQYDFLLIQLAAKGHPRTTLSYDVFLDNTGMTSTESDKKQIMVFQLQNRIQDTLRGIKGVENAVVNLTIPDDNASVWQMALPNQQVATAAVTLTLGRSVELNPDQVQAVKTLVAASVPKMLPDNVKVINAATSLELEGAGASGTTIGASVQSLQLEKTFQELIESNVKRILVPIYGDRGVYVVARVTLDLDGMMQERYELIGRKGADGEDLGGFAARHEVEGIVEGEGNVSGIVGEENNTDVPTYPLMGTNNSRNFEHYYGAIDYDYGYLKTQIEKGNGHIKRGTVSVLVDEKNMTEDRRLEIIDIISKSADIAPEYIALSALNLPPSPLAPIASDPVRVLTMWEKLPFWTYIVIGAITALTLVLLIAMFIRARRRVRQARLEANEAREREEALLMEMEYMRREQETLRAAAEAAAAEEAREAMRAEEERARELRELEERMQDLQSAHDEAARGYDNTPDGDHDADRRAFPGAPGLHDTDGHSAGADGDDRLSQGGADAQGAPGANDMEEFERYKRELADMAMADSHTMSNAITNEVRQFAQDNPEITANLLRNWLKDGEE